MNWDPEQARRMKDAGATLKLIGKKFGIDPGTVKTRLDPEYAEHRRVGVRTARRARRGIEVRMRVTEIRYVRSTPELNPDPVPNDTRNITARICGDPLPGRSALDQRRA